MENPYKHGNRHIDEVVEFAAYLDSSMRARESLRRIHERVHQLWLRFAGRYELFNARSRWVWRDHHWVPR